jgi:hypothetical protein
MKSFVWEKTIDKLTPNTNEHLYRKIYYSVMITLFACFFNKLIIGVHWSGGHGAIGINFVCCCSRKGACLNGNP